MARQAVVDRAQAVVGHALFNHTPGLDAHSAASDVILAFAALSHAGGEEIVGPQLLFLHCTHDSLVGGHLELLPAAQTALVIPPLPASASAADIAARVPMLRSLRDRHFQLVFGEFVLDPAYRSWLALAQVVQLDLQHVPLAQVTACVDTVLQHSSARVMVCKVETQAQFDALQGLRIALFQGYWFAHPTELQAKLLAPNQTSLIQLIGLLRRQASTEELEAVVKMDVGLAFNLLRLINSAAFGLRRPVTSFREAVLFMGLKKMFRWAALMLASSPYGCVPALGPTAVVRARLMELLAPQLSPAHDADEAFLTGLFSLLDVMLGIPMAQALHLVHAPQAVADALLHRQGPLGDLLQLSEACERVDAPHFDQFARALQLTDPQINLAHLQALAWQSQVSQAIGQP